MATLQHMFGQPLGAAGVGRARVQNGFHQREFGCPIRQVRAADHVAHDKHVGLQRHLVGAKALDQLDAQGAQLVAHGWVDASVAARDAVTRFTCQSGQSAHESATNAKNMNMHRGILPVQNAVMDALKAEIAAVAARMVAEEGLAYGPAKRRAVKQLGLPLRTALPDNDAVEVAVEEYIAVFCADTQPSELRVLRELALAWMDRLERFQPHLGGAVWHGTATQWSDIYLQLFCDDPKAAEIGLIDMDVRFAPSSVTGFHGGPVDALSVNVRCPEFGAYVGLHLLVNDLDDFRGALLPDARGRRSRGSAADLRRLLHDGGL